MVTEGYGIGKQDGYEGNYNYEIFKFQNLTILDSDEESDQESSDEKDHDTFEANQEEEEEEEDDDTN